MKILCYKMNYITFIFALKAQRRLVRMMHSGHRSIKSGYNHVMAELKDEIPFVGAKIPLESKTIIYIESK